MLIELLDLDAGGSNQTPRLSGQLAGGSNGLSKATPGQLQSNKQQTGSVLRAAFVTPAPQVPSRPGQGTLSSS